MSLRKFPALMIQSNLKNDGGSAPPRYGEARARAMPARQPSNPCSLSRAPSALDRAAESVVIVPHPAAVAFSFQMSRAAVSGCRKGDEALASSDKSVPEGVEDTS